jgi:hypothetical protein
VMMPDTSTEWGLQPHAFVESEFENGAGKCDRCAAPKEAAIHSDRARVDPMVRIAEALETLAHYAEVEFEARLARSRMTFWERIRTWWVSL